MSKEERLTIRVENLENAILKGQAKVINELGLVDKIKIVAVKKIALAAAFTTAVEQLAEKEGEEKIPDTCSDLYNDLHTDEESPLDKAPEKKKPAKKGLVKKDGKKKTGPPQKPVDEYGTRTGTLAFTFVQEVKKKPQTMADCRKADWNPRGYHFDNTIQRLIAEGKASLDEKEVITIK